MLRWSKRGRKVTTSLLACAHSRLVALSAWKDAAEVVTVPQTCGIAQWASRSPPVTQDE